MKWKPIKTYEDIYEISSTGIIRRIKSTTCGNAGMVKSTYVNKKWGYKYAVLYKDGKPKAFRVSRLVAIAFIPNIFNKEQVNHINGIKTDDNVTNLEWNTRSENQKHAIRIGLRSAKGIKNSQSKLTEKDIINIKELKKIGFTQNEIATKFNISQSNVSVILSMKTWKHL